MQSKRFYPVRVLKHAWRENPKRILSIVLGFIPTILRLREGFSKRHIMLEMFNKALKPGSEDWLDMQQKLEVTGKTVSDNEVRHAIEQKKPEMMKESTSMIKKAVVGGIMSVADAFYSLDQLYKGEKEKTGQQDVSHVRMERERKEASMGVSR